MVWWGGTESSASHIPPDPVPSSKFQVPNSEVDCIKERHKFLSLITFSNDSFSLIYARTSALLIATAAAITTAQSVLQASRPSPLAVTSPTKSVSASLHVIISHQHPTLA